jgi:hypothetical protein
MLMSPLLDGGIYWPSRRDSMMQLGGQQARGIELKKGSLICLCQARAALRNGGARHFSARASAPALSCRTGLSGIQKEKATARHRVQSRPRSLM